MKKEMFDSELLDFAKEFSDNYKTLSTGEYFSNNQKYHIRYVDKIKGTRTGARISSVTGQIEIDKSIFMMREYTSDFIFFIILWCIVSKDTKDMILVDKTTIEYYLTTGASKKNIALGYLKLFSGIPTSLNHKRYRIITDLLGEL